MRVDEAVRDQAPPAGEADGDHVDGGQTPPPSKSPVSRVKVPRSEIILAVRNSLKLGSSLLLTWATAFIVKLQVPAHLGPIRQGHFSFSEGFATAICSVLGLGVDTYVIKEISVRPKHASDFVGGVFLVRTILGIGLIAFVAVMLRATGRSEEIQHAAIIFAVTQLFLSLNATLAAVLQAVSNVGGLAVTNVVAKVLWGAGLLAGLHYGVDLYVLALAMLIPEILRTAFLVPVARGAADLRYRIDMGALRAVLIASFPFFMNTMAVTVGNSLGVSALEFVRRDQREVGWFGASMNIGTLAMLLHPLLAWIFMPLLSRAHSRSIEEMNHILRRCVEGLILVIAPITTIISAGSDILLRAAFGVSYLPATLCLSILSLMFVMTYLNIVMATVLIITGKSWTVTLTSFGSILLTVALMLGLVPLGRWAVGVGGECAGAAAAVIGGEFWVVLAMLRSTHYTALDARNIRVLMTSIGIAFIVLLTNHVIRHIGAVRLIVDGLLYALLALATGAVRRSDVQAMIRVIRARGREPREQGP